MLLEGIKLFFGREKINLVILSTNLKKVKKVSDADCKISLSEGQKIVWGGGFHSPSSVLIISSLVPDVGSKAYIYKRGISVRSFIFRGSQSNRNLEIDRWP